jgi:FkbM family methyltransferase
VRQKSALANLVGERPLKVVGVASRPYFALTKAARLASEVAARGRGVGLYDSLMQRIFDRRMSLVTLRVNGDSRLVFSCSDSYWGHYLLEGRPYEPEVEHTLREIRDLDWTFVDGGANLGYWCVLASSREFGAHKSVAVEMSPDNFELLQLNCSANEDRFATVRAALDSISGLEVNFSNCVPHQSRTIASSCPGMANKGTITAKTVSLDDLVARYCGSSGFVVKLDIEGVEGRVIQASSTLDGGRDVLLIFESHYKEAESEAVRACLDKGLAVAYVDSTGTFRRIHDVESAKAVKVLPGKGYNFLAFSASDSTGPIARRLLEASSKDQ